MKFLVHRFRSIGFLGHLLGSLFVAAAFNFFVIFLKTLEVAFSGVCYFGPPAPFRARFLIAASLLIASVGLFDRSFPRSTITVIGLAGAFTTYIFWWFDSYRMFRNLTEIRIDFLNNPEIKQVAYLYQGAWLDLGVAVATVVCLVLFLERLFSRECHAPSLSNIRTPLVPK